MDTNTLDYNTIMLMVMIAGSWLTLARSSATSLMSWAAMSQTRVSGWPASRAT